MNVIRFEPWPMLNPMQRDLSRTADRPDTDVVPNWVPAVDVIEEKDCFILKADLPGVSPGDIELNMEDGVLSLSGDRSPRPGTDFDGLKRVERASGKFYRRFSLPDTANADEISARSANGILEISIPKAPQIKARRINVEAA